MKIVKVGRNKYRRYNFGDFVRQYSWELATMFVGITVVSLGIKIAINIGKMKGVC